MEDILRGFPNIQLQKQLPSYVRTFVPELQDGMFLHMISAKTSTQLENSANNDCQHSFNSDSTSECDVTGSPLKLNLYSLRLQETVLNVNKFWSAEEENHLPISLEIARKIVGRYIRKMRPCHVPLWVVCDAMDGLKTLLLSGWMREGWCSRSAVYYVGKLPLSLLQNVLIEVGDFDETIQVSSDVHCVFILHEENDFGNSLDETCCGPLQNCSKILIHLTWCCASFEVPHEGVSAALAMDLNIGYISSSIFPLWSQLNFLVKYYQMLNDVILNRKHLILSDTDSPTLSHQNISRRVIKLMNDPENTSESLSWMSNGNDIKFGKSGENILTLLIKQVINCTRPDCDVTDKIWLVLNEITDIRVLTNCLNNVLLELGNHKSKTHTNLRKNTFLAKIIAAHLKGELAVTELSIKKTLEIMIETGMEKLKEDYIYVFKRLGVECSSFKNISTSIAESRDIVKCNINVLAQLHVALDFILVTQFYFNVTGQGLSTFAQNAFDKCCQKVPSFDTLQNNSLVSLEIPMNFESILDYLPSNFSYWKMVTSSKEENVKDYSTLLLSSQPLFPPSIFQCDSENVQGEIENTIIEQQYYVYKLSCWCDVVEVQNESTIRLS